MCSKLDQMLSYRGQPSIIQTCLNLFRENVFTGDKNVQKMLIEASLGQIRDWRETDNNNWIYVNPVISSLITIASKEVKIGTGSGGSLKWVDMTKEPNYKIYETVFEIPFIKDVAEYYRDKANGWCETMNAPEYVKTASNKISEEER